jgi:copper transport protein
VAWRRWRRRPRDGAGAGPGRLDDGAFLGLAVRWSALAAWVLLAVAAAGAAMALSIIDGWGDLTGTGWGKVLLFKLAVTLVAAACGAYNRFALIPALDRRPSDPNVRERIVDALAAEAFVLVVAAVLAGVLVGATI